MVNVTALTEIADYLKCVDRSKVNMSEWMIIDPASVSDDDELSDDWRCNTVACVAGWAVINAGWLPDKSLLHDHDVIYVTKDGRTEEIFVVGAEVLGLTEDQAVDLFVNCHTVDDAIRYIHVELIEPQLTAPVEQCV